MIYVRVTEPAETPIALEELVAHLRIEADDTGENTLVQAYLDAAVEHLDGRSGILNRCLVTQTWQAFADRPEAFDLRHHHGLHPYYLERPWFWHQPHGPRGFVLDLGPVQIGDTTPISVSYRSAGAWVDVDPASFRALPLTNGRAMLALEAGQSWPEADHVPQAWRIAFTAGFGNAAAVPATIKAALFLIAADLYGNRDGKTLASLVENPTIARLLAPYQSLRV